MSETLQEKIEAHRVDLVAMGWSITVTDTSAALYAKNKKGGLYKYPDVTLAFSDSIYSHHDFEGPEPIEIFRPVDQPWLVSAAGYGHRYKNIDDAIASFCNQAAKRRI